MKFGKVDDPGSVDFTLPVDHHENERVLKTHGGKQKPTFSIGCAKWNRSDLKGFYPRGTKDELEYYSTQFNSIELNATFYRLFPAEQFEKWRDKTLCIRQSKASALSATLHRARSRGCYKGPVTR